MIQGVECHNCQTAEHLREISREQIDAEEWSVIPSSQVIAAYQCTACGTYSVVAHHWRSPKV